MTPSSRRQAVDSIRGVTVATSRDEVEGLRQLWSEQRIVDLDSDIDYFLTVVDSLPGVLGPHVVCIARDGRPPLLVVARLASHPFPVKAGYTQLMRPRLRALVVSLGGVLGATSEADFIECVAAIRGSMAAVKADAVIFQGVERDTPLHTAIRDAAGPALRVHGLPESHRWIVELPETLDQLLERRSVKARKEARYEQRRLRRKYDDDVKVLRLEDAEPEVLRAEIERVASKSYQRALGVGASNDDFGRATLTLNREAGRMRVWMLYLRGVPVAFWWGNLYGTNFAIDTPSFDPEYAADGVGIFVMHEMLEELCTDPAVETVDFGHGDAEYKKRYARPGGPQSDLVILAPRLRALAVGSIVSIAYTSNRAAYKLLRESAIANKIRRAWRSRLAAQNANTARS